MPFDVGRIASGFDGCTTHLKVATAALACLDAHIRPMLILDADLRILWANALASELIQRKPDLSETGGMLALSDPEIHARLLTLLKQVHSDLITFCAPLQSGTGHLLVRARRLECEGRPLFGVQIMCSDSGGHDIYRDLDTAFALTPAEHRVLLLLLSGNEADRLTEILAVSIDTVRTHIRNIYAKLEVNSREQLFAKAQPFRI